MRARIAMFSTALILAALAFCATASAQQVHAFSAAELRTADTSAGLPAVLTSPPPPPKLSEAQKAILSGAGRNYLYGSWRTELAKRRASGFKPALAQVSPPSAPTVKTVNNRAFDASFGTYGVTENETSVAFSSATVPPTIAVGFLSTQDLEAVLQSLVPTGGLSGYSRSTDGGSSWTEVRGGLPQTTFNPGGLSGPLTEVPFGDPSIVADSAGNFYYSTLSEDTSFSWVMIYKSTDGAKTFGPLAGLNCLLGEECMIDKPSLAIDPGKGNLYLTFTLLGASIGSTGVNIDEATFDAATGKQESLTILSTESGSGSNPAAGPSGSNELYVAWEQFTTGGGTTNVDQIEVTKSTDGGAHFSTPVKVADVSPIGRGAETDNVCLENAIKGAISVNDFPSVAVDVASSKFKGNVYITWNNNALTFPNDDSDIVVSTSSNGGTTWSAPTKVNLGGKGTDQFFPWVSVLPNGKVGITYYDRGADPNNWHIDVSDAISTDGGISWANGVLEAKNFPVIINADPDVPFCYMGDYNQVINNGSNFLAAWGDNTNGDADVVFGTF